MLLEKDECVHFYSEKEKCDILLALDADGYDCSCYYIKDGVVGNPCYSAAGWVFLTNAGRIDGAYQTQPSDIAITYEEFMGRTVPLTIHGLNLEDLL